jgi:hypothetical protein
MTIALAAIVVGWTLWPAEAHAQRRRVVGRRAPVRASVVVGVTPHYYRPYYYRPWFYDPWLPYGYPYGWYQPYGYYGRGYDGSASVRLQVEPRNTEVFVDGYWAGTVDDFDGFFQRLHLEPGEHDVELHLDGHRNVRQKIYLQPNGTFRIRHTMTPLGPGETPDPRPAPAAGSQPRDRYDAFGRGRDRTERPEPRERPEARERPEPPERRERSERGAFGTIAIRVQPGDAEVLIDGEPWEAPETADRLIVELPEGEHRLEVRKDGFATYAAAIRVRRGETTTVNVSLARASG